MTPLPMTTRMKRVWKALPDETKELIRNAGLAPDE